MNEESETPENRPEVLRVRRIQYVLFLGCLALISFAVVCLVFFSPGR